MRKVKWSIRDDGNSTWGKHKAGPYLVTVTDCDGDGTEWAVYLTSDIDKAKRKRDQGDEDAYAHAIAKGEVSVQAIDDFEIGQAVAIEALDAIIRARSALPQE
jgi:hypothetical protein